MNKKLKRILPLIALVTAAAVLLGVWSFTRVSAQEGSKALTVTVVHSDGSSREFSFTTDAENLAEALVEERIVEENQSAYGLYILTADGETADEGKQEWWCLTKGGEVHMHGANDTMIADGDHYELTFTVGYGF